MKIGVFDSGIGGITVLTSLRERFPVAEYVYLGDNANLPYGTKSRTQVVKLSLACADRLREEGVHAVIVACNTASSLAIEEVSGRMHPIPVYGVVEPGVQAVLAELWGAERSQVIPILVLATRATVRSGAYGSALRRLLDPGTRPVFEQACPLLVPMIEEGWTRRGILRQTLDEYVAGYRNAHRFGVALLGCTHYPWIQEAVEAALPGWKVVNSAQALGKALEKQILAAGQEPSGRGVKWIFTDPDALPAFAQKFITEFISEGSFEP